MSDTIESEQVGKWHSDGDESWRRISELQRRNSLYPPHMRSAYPVEMQFRSLEDYEDDKLRVSYSCVLRVNLEF